jgi:hypothetical protein
VHGRVWYMMVVVVWGRVGVHGGVRACVIAMAALGLSSWLLGSVHCSALALALSSRELFSAAWTVAGGWKTFDERWSS